MKLPGNQQTGFHTQGFFVPFKQGNIFSKSIQKWVQYHSK